MASFPTAKVHRVSRRRLGRGQKVQVPYATITASAATVTVTITFSVPVIVVGKIPLVITAGGNFVSQTQTSPTTVQQVYDATCAGKAWTIGDTSGVVHTYQGGGAAPAAGTFSA